MIVTIQLINRFIRLRIDHFLNNLKDECENETAKSVLPMLLKNVRTMINKAREGASASQIYMTKLNDIENSDTKRSSSKLLDVDSTSSSHSITATDSPTTNNNDVLPLNSPKYSKDVEYMQPEQITELMKLEKVVSGPIRKSDMKNFQKIRDILEQDSVSPGKMKSIVNTSNRLVSPSDGNAVGEKDSQPIDVDRVDI